MSGSSLVFSLGFRLLLIITARYIFLLLNTGSRRVAAI